MAVLRPFFAALLLFYFSSAAALFGQAQALGEDLADEDDRGFLTELLEDSLGGEDRFVRITGFRGALSSEATMDQITIADSEGVWLTLNEITMQWNRSALLRGRVEVTTLSAAGLSLERLPNVPEDTGPSPEAQGFALPDLPVAVILNELVVNRISLGAPVLGEPAEMSLEASARLVDGSAEVALNMLRTDGATGRFIVDGAYTSSDDLANLSLDLSEGEGGIVARLLDIPGQPDLRLTINGEGPTTDLVTQVELQTAGEPRLAGTVTLTGRNVTPNTPPARTFNADLQGDLAPLFPAQYGDFFGDDVALRASGSRSAEGALDLSRLELTFGASELSGSLTISPENQPLRAVLDGVLQAPDGDQLLLPITGGETSLRRAEISLQYEQEISEDWNFAFNIDGLSGPQYTAATLALSGTGRLTEDALTGGQITLEARGLGFEDPALQEAVGTDLDGRLEVEAGDGGDLTLRGIDLSGADYKLAGAVGVAGLEQDFRSDLDLRLTADDLGRFGPLIGLDIKGSAGLDIEGEVDLGGQFDLVLAGAIQDLSVGIERVDPILRGRTELSMSAIRDTQGTRLPGLTVENDQLRLSGKATLATDASKAEFDLLLPDASVIDPALKGALALDGAATQSGQGWSIAAKAAGPYKANATVVGRITGAEPSLEFDAKLPEVQAIVPSVTGAAQVKGTAALKDLGWIVDATFDGPYDASGALNGRVTGSEAPDLSFVLRLPDVARLAPAYRGALELEGRLNQSVEGLNVDTDLDGPYGLTGTVSGVLTGASPQVRYSLRVPDIGPLGVPINGPLALDGLALQEDGVWQINTSLIGPGGADARVSGTFSGADAVNIQADGTAPLGLADPFLRPRSLQGTARFSLQLNGRAALSNLTGTVETSNARFSAPTLAIAIADIGGRVTLNGGQAAVALNGNLVSGGRVNVQGDISLAPPMQTDLRAQLTAIRLVDPKLYDASLNGALTLAGPLRGGARLGGQVDISEAEIQIPSSRATGFSIVPEVVHVNAKPAVRQTLLRAGLGPDASRNAGGGGGAPLGLDLGVSAPNRIFVRGRGIDAELGGQLRLRGTTANIITSGQFNLIRGRLDVLGKRFVLDEGRVTLQGRFDPAIRFVATTTTSTGTASVIVEGRASEPDVRFTAVPDAPQDEILAQIFFGRSLTQLSPFQVLQLASAVATLAGGGGNDLLTGLRRGFDLDDLDITTDEGGNTSLRLGKYLTDNVYTDVEIGGDGTQGVSINVDLTSNLTARGTLKSDGNSSIGVVFERDY